jgi:flagellar biosynthesis protein FlhF
MVEETFVAPTPREAFELAREKYGVFSDLKLLRAIHQQDEEGRLRAHIVVSVPEEDYVSSIGIDEEEELIGEIHQLREQMERMKSAITPQATTSDAIREIRTMLEAKGLQPSWLDPILDPFVGESMAGDKSLLLSYVLEEMDEQLRVQPEILEGNKRLMLLGSTGVGKSTTLAKLAARYGLNALQTRSVALINLDTFRVGAYEQMEHYATTMGIRHLKVDTIEGFRTALDELAAYDVVLIDTAGISPYDIGRLVQTVEFLRSLPAQEIETALVISATAKYDDIVAIHDHFSFVEIGSVILTKFDETRRIGEALGFVLEKQLPVSYVSSGQVVPDDLEVADKEAIMIRFVEELHV